MSDLGKRVLRAIHAGHPRRSRWLCDLRGHRECHCGYCKRCGSYAFDAAQAVSEAMEKYRYILTPRREMGAMS
jgi:hypothetical protein